MNLNGNEIAVEISILTQHVIDKSGKVIPRLSQDSGVLRLCDEIEEELKNIIPSGVYILLTISAPLNKIRQTKADLINEIKSFVQKNASNKEVIEINKNEIEIQSFKGNRLAGVGALLGL